MHRLRFLILMMVFFLPVVGLIASDSFSGCLPKDVDLKAKVRDENSDSESATKSKPKTTVEKKLREVGATCKKGRLVDKSDKEIRFVHLIGCWGNPPENYQEQLDKQQAEVSRLKDKYTVIEIPCDQSTAVGEIQ
jgi:hypothetical protein